MILHVVLLQLKPETTQEEIQTALTHVRALQQKIPGIVEIHAGENHNRSNNKGYAYGFAMRFMDEAHLKAYAPHPEHQVVSAELVRICGSVIDFDLAYT